MSKALRQFLVLLIFACIIVLAVLVVQVFILGERKEPDDMLPSTVVSETPPPESLPEETPEQTVESTPPVTDTTPASPEVTDSESPLGEGMERVELPLTGLGTLVIDYYTELFMHDEQDMGDMFLYTSPEGGDAMMSVLFLAGKTAAAAAPGFFDEAEPDTITPVSAQSIGRTGMTGQYVKATLGETVYEAWLVDIEGGVIAFSIYYTTDEQMNALHGLVNYMHLN